MIDFIAAKLFEDLKETVEQCHFISILKDGSTDTSITEKEAISVITFDPTPPGTDMVGIKITFLALADLVTTDSRGILEAIKKSLLSLEVEDVMKKLVGFGSDGSYVNSGEKKE